jgi:hypothetical protein
MSTTSRSLFILSAVAAPAHAAASWNAGADFSATSNLNSPWAYGTRATSNGTAFSALNDTLAVGPVAGWWDAPSNELVTPFIGKNLSGATFQSSTVTWLAGDFTMHPGPVGGPLGKASREFAVTRWTAPTAGLATIFSEFRLGSFRVNFNFTQSLSVGDTLDLVVGNAGNYQNDTTVLDANIVIPEPGTVVVGGPDAVHRPPVHAALSLPE